MDIEMTTFQEKLDEFYDDNIKYINPLEKIINNMLNKCRYINGESLERHNWGLFPKKLNNIPNGDVKSQNFEINLLNVLEENDDKSILELLWGDVQLGKRVHACIVMWILNHIYKRPILYICRNLDIDMEQIKNSIKNFNDEYIRPFLNDSNFDKTIFKRLFLKNFESIDFQKLKSFDNFTGNFCCLMNSSQLTQINQSFIEYIKNEKHLVDVGILVDEADLSCPTSKNDHSEKNNVETTDTEKLLSLIYKKVRYVLHITGTAHSLLYNFTTKLNSGNHIQNMISKVHKMRIEDGYYGFFNDKINFHTNIITWWEKTEKTEKVKYDILIDYDTNIKKIIGQILKRPIIKYNSLLISEETNKNNQSLLVNKILIDFDKIFVIIYNGDCLIIYLNREYDDELKKLVKTDELKELRDYDFLNKKIMIYDDNKQILPNNYGFYDIKPLDKKKKPNIKLIYKLVRIFFEKCSIENNNIINKTAITISGKYGERGYSFTSDDYGQFSFHLTDQYFVSHSNINCTYLSQRGRIQGKYNDEELKTGDMKLTLWTTEQVKDVLQNFYIKFIKLIEKHIMDCNSWQDIKLLIESILDIGDLRFKKYMKYLDVKNKMKNIKCNDHYDKSLKSYKLLNITDMTEEEIFNWCVVNSCCDNKLPTYNCVNNILEMNKNDFENNPKYEIFKYKSIIPFRINNTDIDINDKENTLKYIQQKVPKCTDYRLIDVTSKNEKTLDKKTDIKKSIQNQTPYHYVSNYAKYTEPNICHIIIYPNKNYYHIVGCSNEKELKPLHNNIIKNKPPPYIVKNDVIYYSELKSQYDNKTNKIRKTTLENLGTYYWKSPTGLLYLYENNDFDKRDVSSISITEPKYQRLQDITEDIQNNQSKDNKVDNQVKDNKVDNQVKDNENNHDKVHGLKITKLNVIDKIDNNINKIPDLKNSKIEKCKINNDELKISEYSELLKELNNRTKQNIKINGRDKQFKEILKIIELFKYTLEITIILENNNILKIFKYSENLKIYLTERNIQILTQNTLISIPKTPINNNNFDYTFCKILSCNINNEVYNEKHSNNLLRYLCELSDKEFKDYLHKSVNDCIKKIKEIIHSKKWKLELVLINTKTNRVFPQININ